MNFSITAFIGSIWIPFEKSNQGRLIFLDSSWEREYPALRNAIGTDKITVAFSLETFHSSVMKATQLSRILIALVSAAKNRSTKKNSPKILPPGSPSNTSGRAIKAKPPPIPRPSAPRVTNTTGIIAKAARNATSVSRTQMQAALFTRLSFFGT